MQLSDAKRLREQWAAKGNPTCTHPVVFKEYYLGSQTGDFVCDTCGAEFTERPARPVASHSAGEAKQEVDDSDHDGDGQR